MMAMPENREDWVAKFFTADEMRCKCGCCQSLMDQKFMDMLDALRDCYGRPMFISSGYRCRNHPVEMKKQTSGAHTTGKAADIVCSREDALNIIRIATQLGFTGIGVQQKGTTRFIHVDTCTADEDGLPRPTIWSY